MHNLLIDLVAKQYHTFCNECTVLSCKKDYQVKLCMHVVIGSVQPIITVPYELPCGNTIKNKTHAGYTDFLVRQRNNDAVVFVFQDYIFSRSYQ
jgi:hypothetical protein